MSPRAAAFSIYSGWGFGEFHPQGTAGGWVARTSNGTTAHSISDSSNLQTDSSGNIYGFSSPGWVTKYNSAGTLQWITLIGGTYSYNNAICTDSSGNTIIGYSASITSINSSGGLSWTKNFTGNSGAISITTDSSGNIYFTTNNGKVFALNSAGTILWVKTVGGTGSGWGPIYCYGSNLYLTTGITAGALISKINTSGTLIWSYTIANNGSFNSIKVDSAGKILLIGNAFSVSFYYTYIAKLTDSGSSASIDWQYRYSERTPYGVPDYAAGRNIGNDSSNNYYFTFQNTAFSNYTIYVGKIDSSGNPIFIRIIDNTSSSTGGGLVVNSANKLYASTKQLWQLPTNGTGVGTYQFTSPTTVAHYWFGGGYIYNLIQYAASYALSTFAGITLTAFTSTPTTASVTATPVTGYSNQRIDF
jgi:hypothetical protein